MIKFSFLFLYALAQQQQIPVAARFLGLRFRIRPGAWLCLVAAVSCQVLVSATDSSLVQRSPTEFGLMCVSH